MKIQKLLLTMALAMITISNSLSSQTLSYIRLTDGLNIPEFEGGRTDFRMEDINMDGHIDILTIGDHGSPGINAGQHGVCVWFGDGSGNFTNYMNGDFGYGGLAIGDVNNDGYKDIGYGMHHNYSSTDFGDQILEVSLGDGTGMNWIPWDDGLASNGETWGMFGTDFGDVDNDGDLDIVSNSFGSGAGLHVYLNQGDGTWIQSFGFLGGNSDNLVEFADFNNDGFLDFICGHEGGTAYFGDGSGNFIVNDTGLPVLGAFSVRIGVSTGDANNDGAKDIALANSAGGVNVFIFNPTFNSWINFSGSLPTSGAYEFTEIADMNSDGFADVAAIAGQNIKIWLGDGQGNWTLNSEFSLGSNANAQAFRIGGDLDHNGRPDMVLLAETGNWPSYQNHLYCYKESSIPVYHTIKPLFPKGGENLYPNSVQFIEWISQVPGNLTATVKI
jgi:hypothetical protein